MNVLSVRSSAGVRPGAALAPNRFASRPVTIGKGDGLVQMCARNTATQAVATDADASLLPWQKLAGEIRTRTDIETVMIVGAGPIVIGQACEFDYSGTQACKALKAEGYKVILLNSNPATIMTDPGTADRTYIGPMTPELVEQILEKEKPDAILPTMGGQTGLNIAKTLSESGILDKHNVELIGAKLPSIDRAEDRDLFKKAMDKLGLKMAVSKTANTVAEALEIAENLIGRYPIIIRPAFTLGGTGGGIAYNQDELVDIVTGGLDASMTNQVLVEQSLLGWKEYELEVMRDLADNVVIVCSIENVDPMGVHTGDSITVAPQQTLTDREYQRLRDASVAIIREMGVECGGSNVQLATNPATGDMVIIEMNPRVSRSSALASKATGFPIAKMATKLAMGMTLDQIPNDITQKTPASFEPSIDYIITKMPRFTFEKFPGSKPELSTMMRSVGETMAMGRTWVESFQKACRGLETGLDGWSLPNDYEPLPKDQLLYKLRTPNPERFTILKQAYNEGMTTKEIFDLTAIDPWWLDSLRDVHDTELWLREQNLGDLSADDWREVKSRGFSDAQVASFVGADALAVREARKALGVTPSYKRVDTCAAEFAAETPYLYSCYEEECEAAPTSAKKVLILGGGPNRIGQGIEFDYCCCHASYSLRDAGYETIMMNSNPETVSTDYDTSSRLYFEPLTVEDVLNVIDVERPEGIIVQFGGQTPLKLATQLQAYLDANPIASSSGEGNVQIWGTSPASIDEAEDRDRWMDLLTKLDIRQPAGGSARSSEEAVAAAERLGFPVMVRPSYVLGGRAMEIVYSDEQLDQYLTTAVKASPDHPVLVDKYLAGATELDVDALCDKNGDVTICGIMEHIEEAGVHSGDSACSLPPQTIPEDTLDEMRDWTTRIAKALKVVGLINVQYCIKGGDLYIIEANPRASRTVPFVAKAVGHPIASYASLIMSGKTLKELNFTEEPKVDHVSVKEVVLPFSKFPGADMLLGPEMRSTGEVMGIDMTFEKAYAKAAIAAGNKLPEPGSGVFISVRNEDKVAIIPVAQGLHELGFKILATVGTGEAIKKAGVPCETIYKINEGRPNAGDAMVNGEIGMMIVTSQGDEPDVRDGKDLRRQALAAAVPLITTVSGGAATVGALTSLRENDVEQVALQDYF